MIQNLELTEIDELVSYREGSAQYLVKVAKQQVPLCAHFRDSKNLVVFFPGAHALSAPKPKFQRQNYFKNLDCSCVSFFDPTLFLDPELTLGWFQGGGEVSHLERATDIVTTLCDACLTSAPVGQI
ncbi:hypothetical protein [Roseovarius sp. Pro17]|uniref:hypothetical protein n=1 Tax=Roseovarius sp. Pro17 TaxID=3108175 RepID=UPI002D789146|nr:hypothetical protein [Roseovarius sp. Pro17]